MYIHDMCMYHVCMMYVYICVCMDGCLDGWMDGWMYSVCLCMCVSPILCAVSVCINDTGMPKT